MSTLDIAEKKTLRGLPPENAIAAMKRLYLYMSYWRGAFITMVALLLVTLVLDLLTPLLIESAVDAISFGRGIYVNFGTLSRSVGVFILFAATGSVMECLLGRISAKITLNMSKQLRRDTFDSLMDLSVSSFERMPRGDLMSRIMNDTEMASGAFSETFKELVCSMIMMIGCAAIMIYKCPPLAAVSIGSSLVSVVLTGFFSGFIFPVLSEQQASLGRLNTYVEESLKTYRTGKACDRSEAVCREIDALSRDYCSWKIRAGRLEYFMGPLMLLFGNLNFLLTLFFGISMILSGKITLGTMQAFIMYSRLFMEPVNSLGEYFIRVQNALAGAERVFALIDRKKEREELSGAARTAKSKAATQSDLYSPDNTALSEKGKPSEKKAPSDPAISSASNTALSENGNPYKKKAVSDPAISSAPYTALSENGKPYEKNTARSDPQAADNEYLVFDSVSFAYRRNFPVLKGVNLFIRRGETLALVGRTGEGKTTLASLLILFYPGYSGEIRLEGQEIRSMDAALLRKKIAVVPQEPQITDGTVYENLVYGVNEVTREEVTGILRKMGILEMFLRLPHGLDTRIKSIGSSMSQGQLQLICLARAMLSEAEVLILDEATSSLDPDTEEIVGQGFAAAMKGRTCIVIAHRISSVKNADHIAVLSDGVISEYGTYDSLMAGGGLYYRLATAASCHAYI